MGKFLKIAGAIVAVILIIAVIGWAALRRGDIPYSELETKYANTQSHYVNLPGGFHIHYRDQGNPKGPTLVLVHGFFVNLDTWEPWVKRLGGDYRVVTLDLPGHGLTRAPQGYHADLPSLVKLLDAFVQAEHIDHFVLGGSSMGGDVAWRYALAHPQKLNGLILVDAAGWPDTRPEAQAREKQMATLGNPVARAVLRDLDESKQVRAGLGAAYEDKRLLTDALVQKYWDLARAPGHRDAIIDLSIGFTQRGYATPETLEALNTPTLILEGAKDQMVPPENASKFASAIHGSRLILYPGLGHVVQEEAPDKTADDVRAFLKSLHPAAAAKKKPDAPKPDPTGDTAKNPNTSIFY